MNKFFLKLVMLPSGIWRGMGADIGQLEAILDIRLKLDDRKPIPIGRQRASKKDRKNGVWMNMFISLIMGAVYMTPVLAIKDRITGLTVSFTLFLSILTLMLITDFSSILYDTRDKYIIVPRPVNDSTIVLSRILHVSIYLLRVMLPMSLPLWIVLGMKDGWLSAVIFIIPVLLMVCIAVFLVNSIYLLLLKLAKPERFNDIINYFQIAFSVLFFGSTMFMNTMLSRISSDSMIDNSVVDIAKYGWIRFLPSYWLASFWSLIGFPAKLPGTQWLSILAVVFPLVCLWVLIKYLAPQFARKISGIDVVAAAEHTPVAGVKARNSKLYLKLANLLNKNDTAKAGFIIAWLQTSRSRSFKMKVYPMVAFMPIYFTSIILQSEHTSIADIWSTLVNKPNVIIFLLYFNSILLMQGITYLAISDQYRSSWVYYSAPVDTPGQVISGAIKALWIKFFLPIFTFLAIFVMSVWGVHTIVDVVLALVNITLFAACMVRVTFRYLPFSMQENINLGSNRVIKSFIAMVVPGALGFGHYLAIDLLWLKLLFLVLSSILLWLVWDSFTNTSWDTIKKNELE